QSGPKERTRSAARGGLAEVKLGANRGAVFIAFATAPNMVAYDGAPPHSPFSKALLDHIAMPNVSVFDMVVEVVKGVRKATMDRQVPWVGTSLHERFCFNVSKPLVSPGPDPEKAEHTFLPLNKRPYDLFVNCARADRAQVEPLLSFLK